MSVIRQARDLQEATGARPRPRMRRPLVPTAPKGDSRKGEGDAGYSDSGAHHAAIFCPNA
jgi:hypothetical protein